jgi:xylulokinase
MIRRCLEHSVLPEGQPLLLTGGGAGSPLWRRIIGAVTSRPVFTPTYWEATPLGAAMLAAAGTGYFASPADAAAAWVRDAPVEAPDAREVERYETVYRLFQSLEAAMEPIYLQAAEMRDA